MKKLVLIFIIIPILSACSVGTDYKRPHTAISQNLSFLNEPNAQNTQSINLWWKRIDDPLLTAYVDQLLSNNLDLKEAGARIFQARARLGIEKGDYYPSLSTKASSSRSFTPGQNDSSVSSDRQYSTNYTVELETSWEIDLFGRIKRSVEVVDASFQATLYDHEALTYSLIAELVNRRVAIAVNHRLFKLAEKNATNRKNFYHLVKNRYDLGVQSTDLEDVLLAKENFTTVKADINQFRRRLTDEIYAFDILIGQAPGTTDVLASEFSILPAPLDIAVCVPASLLDRRPDLKASEFRLKAANADIGVAIANLYPSLNLGATLGFTGDSTGNLFSVDQLAGSIIGSLAKRIFEGGGVRANIDLQKAEAEELMHAYAGDVLKAIGEVESALQAENELAEEVRSLNQSVSSLKKAEEVSEERYRGGLISLRNFLDTQQRLYQIEQTSILREQEKWNIRVALYLALGGDWTSIEKQQEACP